MGQGHAGAAACARDVLCGLRPGLAGGFDYDGQRAHALVATGFAAIEFGTVGVHALPGGLNAINTLAARLAHLRAAAGEGDEDGPDDNGGCRTLPLIGIGLGSRSGGAPATVAADWLAGFGVAASVADYVSLNLSARERRPLLDAGALPQLERAFADVVAACRRLAPPRRPALVAKIPLGPPGAPLPAAALAAMAAGVDGLIAVMPDAAGRVERFAGLVEAIGAGAGVVAVGGIRSAADVAAAMQAGACGVQVHRVFAERGAACVAELRAGFAAHSQDGR